jgi:hypothetical protein
VRARIRLPNAQFWNFDLRTLHLHLALRTTEVLACAEAMWAWVVEFQTKRRKSKTVTKTAGPRSPVAVAAVDDLDMSREVIIALESMTRAEFDGLLMDFDLLSGFLIRPFFFFFFDFLKGI